MVYNKRRISETGKLKPEDEWITVVHHHAAIIEPEQFERGPYCKKIGLVPTAPPTIAETAMSWPACFIVITAAR